MKTNEFWELWEILIDKFPEIADKYCEEDNFAFDCFKNEIKCKSESELEELINEIYSEIGKFVIRNSSI